MKILLYTPILCIALLSCSKDKTNQTPAQSASGLIQYKVNGNLIVMDNTNILNNEGAIFAKQLKGSLLPETRYLLNAQKGTTNIILTAIVTDSLHQINYHYDSTYAQSNPIVFSFTLDYNGDVSSLNFNGDYFDVNISSYKNSRVTGTFSARLSPLSDYIHRGSVLITDGVINNVPVTY